MGQYTKGVWGIRRHGITYEIWIGNYCVAERIYNRANANLLSAAPEMYEALKAYGETVKTLISDHPDDKVLATKMKQIVETLTKAKGGK